MWDELAHNNKGYLYPTAYYWWAAQLCAEVVGVTDSEIAWWHKNSEFGYLSKDQGLAKAGEKIFEKFKTDPNWLLRVVDVNENKIEPMLEAARKLTGELTDISNQELYNRWSDWLDKFLTMMTWSVMGTVLEMEKPYLSDYLEEILSNKLGKNNQKIGEYFQILTTSDRRTVAGQEEIDLIKLKLGKPSEQDINKHVQKYSWIGFGYDGPGWNIDDIKIKLAALPKEVDALSDLLEQKDNFENDLEQKQEKIKQELNFSEIENRLFDTLKCLGFWKFERKFLNQQAHEMMEDFIKEIAKRNNLSIPQVKMLAPNEIEKVIVKQSVDVNELNARLKESLMLFKGKDYKVLTGKQAEPELNQIYQALEVDKNISEFKGTTAYPGIVSGEVKVIDQAHQMDKMNEGDILVSASTSPDILPAMRKAGAIVTNSGGITCHAAIVAREIQKPTVIGTKFASKVLTDGIKVEVNANEGVVKII